MTPSVPGVLTEVSKVFTPKDIEFTDIRVDSLRWELVARISAVLTTFHNVFAPKDQGDRTLDAYISYYRQPPAEDDGTAGEEDAGAKEPTEEGDTGE
jgi:hypothetical protein